MAESTVTPGLYRHYKGNDYEVVGIARHSETEEELVVYHPVASSGLWVRPLTMFTETVDLDGRQVLRFARIGDGTD